MSANQTVIATVRGTRVSMTLIRYVYAARRRRPNPKDLVTGYEYSHWYSSLHAISNSRDLKPAQLIERAAGNPAVLGYLRAPALRAASIRARLT